jgi:putative ABC transport system permease protein
MFFCTYLKRELGRRLRQAIVIAIGLAIGVGLVITVIAWSAGIKSAQASVLKSLYGVGTDVTVTEALSRANPPGGEAQRRNDRAHIQVALEGARLCVGRKCRNVAGQTISMVNLNYGEISDARVADAARLHDVTAAAGGLILTDAETTIPKGFGPGYSGPPPGSNTLTIDGVDLARASLGPLSAARLASGHSFTAADAGADVAVVDSGYAASHSLKAGSTVNIDGVRFTVIGTVLQPAGSSTADVYLPLAGAQALKQLGGSDNAGQVNTIYLTAASGADISAVQQEIAGLLPGATVTTSASLAKSVTGSLASTAKLANDLGRWLAVLVLVAAFAVASLLTLAAVTRRVAEFGTLKALGWRTRRIVGQVLGESVSIGILGGLAGIGAGFGGAAAVTAIFPRLTAYTPGSAANQPTAQPAAPHRVKSFTGGAAPHHIHVPMTAPVTAEAIAAAVLLAVAGGLIAGLLASWRIARLKPAAALTRVG